MARRSPASCFWGPGPHSRPARPFLPWNSLKLQEIHIFQTLTDFKYLTAFQTNQNHSDHWTDRSLAQDTRHQAANICTGAVHKGSLRILTQIVSSHSKTATPIVSPHPYNSYPKSLTTHGLKTVTKIISLPALKVPFPKNHQPP